MGFAHLDATTVLSRQIAELGIYPAVDPLDSTSRMLDPSIVGQRHYDIARSTQKILQDLPTVINDFEEVLSGSCDDLPEAAFYMIGGMGDVREKAAKLAQVASGT